MMMMKERLKKKNNLLNSLREQGFEERIVQAFEKVKREEFVPFAQKGLSYADIPLPIGQGQTIPQPFTIAFMLSILNVKEGEKVLEVGSGSGYVLALLSKINKEGKIFGVERIEELLYSSKERLRNYPNVKIFKAQKEFGLKKHSPFDKILVSASAEETPKELVEQLKIGGVLVIPVKESILKLEKQKSGSKITEYEGFVFVPLVKN